MLEHQQPVGHADSQGAAGATLADHRGNDRHPQPKHLPQVDGDRFALALLLGQEARVGAGGVDEAEDRQAEAVGVIHQPHRLAITTGRGHAEVAGHVLLGVATLLVAQQHHALVAHAAHAAHQRLVVAAAAVAVQLDEFVGQHLDVVQGAGSLRVARHLDLLGRGEVAEDLLAATGGQGFQLQQLLAYINLGIARQLADLLDLLLELHQGLLEIQEGSAGHGVLN